MDKKELYDIIDFHKEEIKKYQEQLDVLQKEERDEFEKSLIGVCFVDIFSSKEDFLAKNDDDVFFQIQRLDYWENNTPIGVEITVFDNSFEVNSGNTMFEHVIKEGRNFIISPELFEKINKLTVDFLMREINGLNKEIEL